MLEPVDKRAVKEVNPGISEENVLPGRLRGRANLATATPSSYKEEVTCEDREHWKGAIKLSRLLTIKLGRW